MTRITLLFSVAALVATLAQSAFALPVTKLGSISLLNTMTGFATENGGTTGGQGGPVVVVTSVAAFTKAVEDDQPRIVKLKGILKISGQIDVGSHKTILGADGNSGFTGGGLRVKGSTNVVIRNLKLSLAKGTDSISLQHATNVWIDHNEFYSLGLVGGKDDYDGLLDITHASNLVTVSWNKFRDHWKGSLIGHSDSNAGEDTGKLKVTYHHNSFTNVNSRLPSLRFGTGHMFSNCYTNCPTSGINSRMGAQVLVENCSFTNVPLSVVTDLDSDLAGYATERNNIFSGTSTTRITQASSFSPPYSYTMTSASNACACISGSAGVGVVTF